MTEQPTRDALVQLVALALYRAHMQIHRTRGIDSGSLWIGCVDNARIAVDTVLPLVNPARKASDA